MMYKKRKIAFFIAYEQSPYAGCLRPFINWSKILINEFEITFVLFNCGIEVKNTIRNISDKIDVFEHHNIEEVIKYLKKKNVEWIMGDDFYPKLKLITEIKTPLNCKSAIYVQVLFGFNSIARVSSHSHLSLKSKILLKGSSLIPFKLLTKGYVNNLKNHDLIIPNSKNVRSILQILYGIDAEPHVYPPVDIDLFKNLSIEKSPYNVLIYLGSNFGDTNEKFLEEIVGFLIHKNHIVNMLGNIKLMDVLKNKFKQVNLYPDLTDAEIVDLYSKNILTICPQKNEMFGYVPVESMACGTPVLAFDRMGPGETIIDGGTGWLAKGEHDFLEQLEYLLNSKNHLFIENDKLRQHIIELCSINKSIDNLIRIFDVHKNKGIK